MNKIFALQIMQISQNMLSFKKLLVKTNLFSRKMDFSVLT